ncbi:hypothetical protein H2200_005672 [Cladophialophora chaetospira]|uniref:Alpha/beta hydrolase fold-3 domain-containing protein n=1 Tax=Cladophialophora chaetospira TaxID=386627 RepID=A0AA39CII7_9EURO|nr:hypothetical protein H2200_005672 [Cladophialophora chaetospira]
MSTAYEEYSSKYRTPETPATVKDARRILEERGQYNQSLLSKPPFDVLDKAVNVTNTTVQLPEMPGHDFLLRVYKPKDYSGSSLPIMCYFHGDFWCTGNANSKDFGCRAIIARGTAIIIASFEYRLVPEVTWQECFNDAEYAMKWVAAKACTLGGDPTKGFPVGGATAGAHLAAICAIRARNRHPNIKLTGQCLIVPTTLAWPNDKIPSEWKERLKSHTEMADAPVLNEKLYEAYVQLLKIPDDEKRNGENFPAWASLEGLPPAYLPMDECDPTRDQGFLYANLLRKAGVLTRVDYYEGLPNMFVHYAELSTTLTAGYNLSAAVKWLLQHEDKK